MAPPLLPQTVTTVASDPNERAEASTLAEQAFVRLRFISLSLVDEARGKRTRYTGSSLSGQAALPLLF